MKSKYKIIKYPGLPIKAKISYENLRYLKKVHNISQKETLKMIDTMMGEELIRLSKNKELPT